MKTPQQIHERDWLDSHVAHTLINRAFFSMAQAVGAPRQEGLQVEARLVERDKAFLGNRLRVLA